jgi:hypothetical protein
LFLFPEKTQDIGKGNQDDACDNPVVNAPFRSEQPDQKNAEGKANNEPYQKNNQCVHPMLPF